MAKNRFNRSWMNAHLDDPYVRRAQKEGYRSRAAFKLQEIDERVRLFKTGQTVVDLGASPGSWSQYVVRKMGKEEGRIKGEVIGIDLLEMEDIEGVRFLQGDFREENTLARLREVLGLRKADVILSDMAPNLSGIAVADAAAMEDLIDMTLEFAKESLKPDGVLLAKCFNGLGYSDILFKFRQQFRSVSPKKPKASRSQSSEVYLLGRGLKGG